MSSFSRRKYALVSSEEPIPDYDQKMDSQQAVALHSDVRVRFREIVATQSPSRVGLSLGKHYRQAIEGMRKTCPLTCRMTG